LKWSDIAPEEMKKFLGLIILMEQVRKDIRDCWTVELMISTRISPSTVNINQFEVI
jgi:hypothetical protein